MFKKHRSPVQGQKSKLVAFVAYALAGLLASGSVYAASVEDRVTAVENQMKAVENNYLNLLDTVKKEKYLEFLATAKQDYPGYKAKFEEAYPLAMGMAKTIPAAVAKLAKEKAEAKDVAALTERVGKNEQTIAAAQANQQQVETNTKDIADINNYLVKQYDSIFGDAPDSLENMVLDNDENISIHKDRLDAHDQDISDVNEALKLLVPTVANNEAEIAKNKEAIGSKADKQKTEADIKDIQNGVTKLAEATLNGLKAKADKKAVEDQFNEVDKFLRTTEKYLEYVDKEVFEESNPDSLVNRVDTNEKAIADKADKTALDAKADKTELDKKADVSKLNEIALNYGKALVDLKENKLDKADLANFEADAAKVKKAAAQISNKADRSEVVRLGNAVNADLTAVKNALNTKANQADLEKVDARVTKVASVVEAQGTAIQSLNNRISGFGSQISDLHNRMEKLEDNVESGLAIQSAHAALFQPYRVGHVNVTAGLGGYKSKTALAVGVGYRFNERVAAKAGVAADTKGKHASYNLGVNFEF